jgi:hypothetical protein
MKELIIHSKGKKYIALIDEEDFDMVSKYTWWIKQNNYIYTQTSGRKNRTSIYLHRLIMNTEKGFEVDHINHNPLDNRKSNLRICTRSQNNMNKLGIHGIDFNKNKWRARIKVNGKEKHLGLFKTYEEAVEKRKLYEPVYFKEFANV